MTLAEFRGLSAEEKQDVLTCQAKVTKNTLHRLFREEIVTPYMEEKLVPQIRFVEPQRPPNPDDVARKFFRENPSAKAIELDGVRYER